MTAQVLPLPYAAARRAEALAILTGGAAYTPSQRAVAWQFLTGMPTHLRAPLATPTPDPLWWQSAVVVSRECAKWEANDA